MRSAASHSFLPARERARSKASAAERGRAAPDRMRSAAARSSMNWPRRGGGRAARRERAPARRAETRRGGGAVEERGALAGAEAHELERPLVEPEVELVAVLLVVDRQRAGLLVGDQVLQDVGQRDRTDVALDSHEYFGSGESGCPPKFS